MAQIPLAVRSRSSPAFYVWMAQIPLAVRSRSSPAFYVWMAQIPLAVRSRSSPAFYVWMAQIPLAVRSRSSPAFYVWMAQIPLGSVSFFFNFLPGLDGPVTVSAVGVFFARISTLGSVLVFKSIDNDDRGALLTHCFLGFLDFVCFSISISASLVRASADVSDSANVLLIRVLFSLVPVKSISL